MSRLESLLDNSLQCSVAVSDPFKDDLTCVMLPYTLIQHLEAIHNFSEGDAVHGPMPMRSRHLSLKGMEAFAFDYQVRHHIPHMPDMPDIWCISMQRW